MSSKKNFRCFAAVKGGAAIQITEEEVVMRGSKSNFVAVDKNSVYLMGKSVVLGTTGENVRQGGLFVNMNDFVRMIPSTMVTPIPPQIPTPPLSMMTGIMKDLPFFIAMVVGAVVVTAAVK